jgi:hypothetical protein
MPVLSRQRIISLLAVQSKRLRLSWKITPRARTDGLAAGGVEAKRGFEAMMMMKKIDLAAIEAARRS